MSNTDLNINNELSPKDNSLNTEFETGLQNEYMATITPPTFKVHATESPQLQTSSSETEDLKDVSDLVSDLSIANGSEDKPTNGQNPLSKPAPEFQLKTNHVVQRASEDEEAQAEDNDDVPVTVINMTIPAAVNVPVKYSDATYDEICNTLSNLVATGDVTVQQESINFDANADQKSFTLNATIKITKHMPEWTQIPVFKAQIAQEKDPKEKDYMMRVVDAWNRVIASLDAHENHHVQDERSIYTAAKAQMKGKTKKEVNAILDGLDAAGKTKSDEFHKSPESEIIKWPIVEREPTKVSST